MSLSGAYAQQVALGWLALRAGGAMGVGLVAAARYLPAAAGPWLGRRFDAGCRRAVLRRTTVAQVLVTAAFASLVAASAGALPLWVLCVFAACYALGATVDAVCTTPVLVDRSGTQVAPAVARMSLGNNLARISGAAVAGVLLAHLSPAAPFALNALSFVGLWLVLVPAPGDHTGHGARPGDPGSPPPGHWWRTDGLWPVTVGFVVFAATAFQPAVLWPTLGDQLVGGASGVATISLLGAVGAVAGGLAALRLRATRWHSPLWGYALCALGLVTLSAAPVHHGAAIAAGAVCFGGGAAWALAKVSTLFARTLPPGLRGRAQGWYRLLLDGTGPLGGLAVAAACAAWTPRAGAALCATLALVAVAASCAARLAGPRHLVDPHDADA